MPDKPLHSLIPLSDFMALLGIDGREEALARYCLLTATFSIEQYCGLPYSEETIREAVSLLKEEAAIEGDGVCGAVKVSGQPGWGEDRTGRANRHP